MRVGIIGGGLFGNIAADFLRVSGHEVWVIDDLKSGRGSAASACLMKPGWMTSMTTTQIDEGLKILEALYTLQSINFDIKPVGAATVYRVDPTKVLARHPLYTINGTVESISPERVVTYFNNEIRERCRVPYDRVIIAAGVWSNYLLNTDYPLQSLAGQANIYAGALIKPFISVWAPYKQLVGFTEPESGHGWVGDGSAIMAKNWAKGNHAAHNALRCDNAVPGYQATERIYGLRPYVKGYKAGLLEEVNDGIWINTGGAKNGTISAAWAALELARRL